MVVTGVSVASVHVSVSLPFVMSLLNADEPVIVPESVVLALPEKYTVLVPAVNVPLFI